MKSFALLATLSVTMAAKSQASELTLASVVQQIDRQHPLLRAANLNVGVADADVLAQEGQFDFVVRASGVTVPIGGYQNHRLDVQLEQPTPWWGATFFTGYRLSDGKFPVYDQKFATNSAGEVRGGVRLPTLRDGPIDRRRVAIRRAELTKQLAALSVAQSRIEVVFRGSLRYWDWVAAGARLRAARDWLSLAEKRQSLLKSRADHGDIAPIEVQENERTVLQRQAAVVAAERDVEVTALELSVFLIGENGTSKVPTRAELPRGFADDGEELQRVAPNQWLARRPEIQQLETTREQHEIDVKLAKNQKLPAVDLVVQGSKDFGRGDPLLDRPALEAMVVFDMPIPARGARGRQRAAEMNVARVTELRRAAIARAQADERQAHESFVRARERRRLASSEVVLAKRLAQAEYDRFEAGDSSLLLVNVREQAAVDAAVREIEANADVARARVSYDAATAKFGQSPKS